MITKPDLNQVVLFHAGVKGMKWGVRKKEEISSKSSSRRVDASQEKRDKAVLKAAGLKDSDVPRLEAKYGPGSMGGKGGLTAKQKKIIAGVAIGVGAAALAYGMYRYGNRKATSLPDWDDYTPVQKSRFQVAMAEYEKASLKNWKGYSPEAVAGLSKDRVTLPAGSVLKRVSTDAETSIRPSGFFAAHDAADVDRYKAVMPTVWNRGGRGDGTGYIVNLKANQEIRAPSPRETLDRFKSILDDEVDMPHLPGNPKGKIRSLFPGADQMTNDEAAAKFLPQFSAGFIDSEIPAVKHFFGKLKGDGFNAVVDLNDAGALAKSPLRVIDGSIFSVAGHERLDRSAIQFAQENIKSLAHAFMALARRGALSVENYLAHAR